MAQLQQTAITGTLTTTDNLTVTGSITNTGNITTGGDITVNGGYIYSEGAQFILKPSSGHTQITGTVGITQTLSASGNITTAGDLAVNGGDITSNASTLFISSSQQIRLQEGVFIAEQGLIVSGGLGAGIVIDRAGVDTEGPGAIYFISSSLTSSAELECSINTNATSFQIYSYNKNLLIATTDGATSRPAISQRQKTYEIGIGRSAVLGTSIIASGSEIVLEASTVSMPSGNISFQSGFGIDFTSTDNGTGTTTSELLSDYEEGTWTPTLSGSTTAGTFTYTSTAGTYTKIGNVVYFTCFLQVTATTVSGSGTVNVTGLPFTISATGTGRTCYGAVGLYSGFATNINNITWNTVPNSSRLNFLRNTSITTSLSTALTHADLAATPIIRFSGFYYT